MAALCLYDLSDVLTPMYRRAVGRPDDARRLRLDSAPGLLAKQGSLPPSAASAPKEIQNSLRAD